MSLFRTRTRKNRNRRRNHSPGRIVSSNVQKLEDRTLLTGDVQVMLSGRDVALFGDAADNEIVVEQMNNWIVVRGLNGTTVNGMNEYLVSGLPFFRDDVLIQLGDGNDVVVFAEGVQVGDDLRIDTGAGNDVVRLSNNRILDDLIIDTGTGDDTILIANTDVSDDLGIFAGPGNNIVSVVDTRAVDDLVVHTANGNDTVVLLGATSGDRHDVQTFGGNNATNILPTYDGQGLPGADVVNQFVSPIATDDFYDAFDGQLVVDAASGVAANDVRSEVGGTTSITVINDVQHGTLVLNQDGSFTYDANGFAGSDSFTYRLTNSFGGFATATVTLTTLEIQLTVDGTAQPTIASNGDTIITRNSLLRDDHVFILHGETTAGAKVEVDSDGDGQFDNGMTDANSDGRYMVAVTLTQDGLNTLQVRSTLANSGRQQTVSSEIYLAIGTVVRFETPEGMFDVELFDGDAPNIVASFIEHLADASNSIVHNIDTGVALQGGTFVVPPTPGSIPPALTNDPPATDPFDSNNLNERGTLSVVLPNDNTTGAATWSINLADNTDFDMGNERTVFGRVIESGIDVVDAIALRDTFNLSGVVPGTNLPNVPLSNYTQFGDGSDGLVDIAAGTNVAIGDSTIFLTNLQPTVGDLAGSIIQIDGETFVVGEIVTDTEMTLLDPGTLQPKNVSSAVVNGSLTFNAPPAPGDYFAVSSITDLFKPTAVDDEFVTLEGMLVIDATNGLLANDIPAAGVPATTVLTTLVDGPANGTVEIESNGSFTYTPNDGFEGTDSFTYRITNSFDITDEGIVNIETFNFSLSATAEVTDGEIVQGNGTLVTKATAADMDKTDRMVTITGTTRANASVEIDIDGDGDFDDGVAPVVADAMGEYSFDVLVVHNNTNLGANHFDVRATIQGTEHQLAADVDVHLAVGSITQFETSLGNFEVELFDADAPLTVDNFKQYFDRYTDSIVHRSLDDTFIIQGGGFVYDGTPGAELTRVETFTPVMNEFDTADQSNVEGTISMALPGGVQNLENGTSQWFINTKDNSNLDGNKHTPFGRVIGNGMSVVQAIEALASSNLLGVFPSLNTGVIPEGALGTTPLTDGYERGTKALDGTVSVISGTNTVTGVGTNFSELHESVDQVENGVIVRTTPGSTIVIGGERFYVGQIISDTQLTLRSTVDARLNGNHVIGAQDVEAFINDVPDKEHFAIFERIHELLLP